MHQSLDFFNSQFNVQDFLDERNSKLCIIVPSYRRSECSTDRVFQRYNREPERRVNVDLLLAKARNALPTFLPGYKFVVGAGHCKAGSIDNGDWEPYRNLTSYQISGGLEWRVMTSIRHNGYVNLAYLNNTFPNGINDRNIKKVTVLNDCDGLRFGVTNMMEWLDLQVCFTIIK